MGRAPIEFGEVWWADNTVHIRNRVVEWDSHATDPRLEGKVVDEFNADINLNAPVLVAKIWGKIWINLEDGSYWEGTWNGEIAGGLQKGSAIAHGRGGSIDGLKLKFSFIERAGSDPTIIDFEATILNPHGD